MGMVLCASYLAACLHHRLSLLLSLLLAQQSALWLIIGFDPSLCHVFGKQHLYMCIAASSII